MANANLEEGRRKLRTAAVGAKVAIAIVVLTTIASGALDALTVNGVVVPPADYLMWGASAPSTIAGVCLVASMFPVGMWIYRAHANLDAADLPALEYSPGWSIGWFAVPFAAMWKPFSAMRELWNASGGAVGDYSATAPGVLWIWWLGWLFGSSTTGSVDSVLGVIGSVALVASAGALWVIVDTVTREQDSMGLDAIFA
jgi:hypothetical protein